MTDTLRERVRERLARIIDPAAWKAFDERRTYIVDRLAPEHFEMFHQENGYKVQGSLAISDAILREFRLQPVAVGKVDAETGEVEAG